MAWHKAQHANAYKCDRPRLEKHYFYAKPWEALNTKSRKVSTEQAPEAEIELTPGYSADSLPEPVVSKVSYSESSKGKPIHVRLYTA